MEWIRLVRHGESEANTQLVKPEEIGDCNIGLTDLGKQQAVEAGKKLCKEFLDDALIYCSPYRRTRETLDKIQYGAGFTCPRIYEDPRLREVDHGYSDVPAQEEKRRVHGWFYYRFNGGESPADCFDRTSGFIESMMRQANRKNAERVLIVTHGLTIRCFVMRFLHLSVEQFETIANPLNCDIVDVAHSSCRWSSPRPQFKSGKWGVDGLKFRPV
jgi:broad specificity phosphatase PhoE